MSIWALLAGGAKKYTQDKELEQASEMEMRRWQEKQNFLEKLTIDAEKRGEERSIKEAGRIRADKLMDDDSRLLEKRADQQRDDAYRARQLSQGDRQLDITDRNTSIAAEANKINRDSMAQSREEGLALRKRQEADKLQQQAYQASFTKDKDTGKEKAIHADAPNMYSLASLMHAEAIAEGDYEKAANVWRNYIASLRSVLSPTDPNTAISPR